MCLVELLFLKFNCFLADAGTLTLLLPVNVGRGRPLASSVSVITCYVCELRATTRHAYTSRHKVGRCR